MTASSPPPGGQNLSPQQRLFVALDCMADELQQEVVAVDVHSQRGGWMFRAAATLNEAGDMIILARAKGAVALVAEIEGWLRGYRAARRAGLIPAPAAPQAEPEAALCGSFSPSGKLRCTLELGHTGDCRAVSLRQTLGAWPVWLPEKTFGLQPGAPAAPPPVPAAVVLRCGKISADGRLRCTQDSGHPGSCAELDASGGTLFAPAAPPAPEPARFEPEAPAAPVAPVAPAPAFEADPDAGREDLVDTPF